VKERRGNSVDVLRIGHLSTFYHTSLLLMAGGIDDRLGTVVEWKLFGTGPDIIRAFERDEIDIAYIGLPPVVIGIDRGLRIKCIAGGHVEGTVIAGADSLRGFPDVQDLGELLYQFRGKSIGVPGRGSIHDVIVRDCIDSYGLAGDVEVINFPWADLIVEAVRKGEVSIAAGTPNLSVALRRFLGRRILWPPERLWPNNPSYGIAVKEGFLGESELIKKFLLLHEDETSFLKRRPVDASKVIASVVGIVDEDFVLETLMVSPKYCASLSEGYISSTMKLVKAMKRLGYIKQEPAAHEIFYTDIINEIHPGRAHY